MIGLLLVPSGCIGLIRSQSDLHFKSQSANIGPKMKVQPDRLASLLGSWAAGSGPLYERLARAVGAAMDRGELPPGTMLPTERDLARRLAVSRTTVVGAYGELKDTGRLESRQGRGTWVAGRTQAPPSSERPFSAELYSSLLGGQPGIIELTAACPPPTSLVTRVVAEMDGADLVRDVAGAGYLPAGLSELRERVAEHLSLAGLPTRPDEVLITTGAQQGIGLAVTLLGEAGQSALVEEATYPGALDITRGLGMRPVGVALDREGVVPEALEDLLERVRPGFVYLVPAHQNPTGSVLSPARSRRVAELSARYRVPVVEDLALRSLQMDDGPIPAPIAAHAPDGASITIGSVSKVLWGGLRVGWIRAARPVIERLMRLKIGADMGSPIPSQSLACALLPRIGEAIEERRRFLLEGYEALSAAMAEHLPDWSWDPPRGGCTLWVRMPGGDARALGQVAQRCGVSVVPGQVLSAEGRHGDRLRLPFVHEPEVIAEAVRRLAVAWEIYAGTGTRPQEPVSLIV
jgi:DNA-binding transcriptional MocR family regulator